MEKRDLYLQKIKAQLEQYSAKISGMHGKATEVNVDMKLEYLKQVKMLGMSLRILLLKQQISLNNSADYR